MKLLTKEQEQAHYNETLKGGAVGGTLGLGAAYVAVVFASRRSSFFRQLTIPFRTFLVLSGGLAGGIITADHWSRAYEKAMNPIDQEYKAREKQKYEQEIAGKTFTQRAMDFGRKERYKIVGGSWIASMLAAFTIVNRDKHMSGTQKLVQARVYAQFLTVGVLIATAAFEISDSRNEQGRYEKVKYIDPKDPEHKRLIEREREVQSDSGDEMWKDMVKAEEERINQREAEEKRMRAEHAKKNKKGGKGKKEESENDEKDDKKDGKKQKKSDDGDDK